MIGIDAHKQTFTAVAVDELGRQVGIAHVEVDQWWLFRIGPVGVSWPGAGQV
jgi:hypothetical protein